MFEARFRATFDNAPIGMALIAPDGSWLDMNKAMHSLFGYSKEELLSKTINDITAYAEDSNLDLSYMTEMLELKRDSYQMEKRYLHKDGHLIWALLAVSAVYKSDGQVDYFISQIQDISEQKRAHERLFKSEALFQSAFDNSGTGMALVNVTGRYKKVNQALCNLLGYEASELLNMSFQDITHPEDLVFEEAKLSLMQGNQQPDFQREKRFLRKNGQYLWVLLSVSKVFDSEGNIDYYYNQIHDIHQRKEAELALEKSEALFRSAFDDAAIGMALVSPSSQWQKVNQGLCNLLGYSEEVLLSKRFQDITHPDDLEKDVTLFEQASTGQIDSFVFEKRFLHALGHAVWVLLNVTPVRTVRGELLYFLNQIVDISERKKAEFDLSQSELRFRTILNTITEGVVVQNQKGEIISCNPRAEVILGLSIDQMMGRSSLDPLWRAIHEDGSAFPGDDHFAMRTLKTGKPSSGIMGVHKPEGTLSWLLVNANPFTYTAQHDIENVVTSFTDITELKSTAQLLKDRAEKLERSNRDLQDFAYVASHDLQEPLRMVSSYVQLLAKRYKDKLDDDAHEFIDFAVDGSKRMQQLINDLLEYSRVETQGESFSRVSSQEILNDVLANLRFAIQDSNALVTHDSLPFIYADRGQMIRLFQNLISNAIKFRGNQRPIIHIALTEQTNVWQFKISDNGIGIDQENLEGIYTLFRRLHTREQYKGTGIGLAVCRRIVERHGGTIWTESEQGKGSSFLFTLPKTQ